MTFSKVSGKRAFTAIKDCIVVYYTQDNKFCSNGYLSGNAVRKDKILFHSMLNKVYLKGFTRFDMDLFYLIVSKLYNKKEKMVTIKIQEILELLDHNNTKFKNKKRFYANIENFLDKLQKQLLKNYLIEENVRRLFRITLFEVCSNYDTENNKIISINVKITRESRRFFNNVHKNNCVAFSLKEFSFITSRSAKSIYLFLKEMECKKLDFYILNSFVCKNIFGNRRFADIERDCIVPALNEFNNLNTQHFFEKQVCYEAIKDEGWDNRGRGKTKGYKFFFRDRTR